MFAPRADVPEAGVREVHRHGFSPAPPRRARSHGQGRYPRQGRHLHDLIPGPLPRRHPEGRRRIPAAVVPAAPEKPRFQGRLKCLVPCPVGYLPFCRPGKPSPTPGEQYVDKTTILDGPAGHGYRGGSDLHQLTRASQHFSGYVAGSGVRTDDWGDEGEISTNSYRNSGATGLWQWVLYADGAIESNGGAFDQADIDCDFGPNTVAATKSWQRDHDLTDDGRVASTPSRKPTTTWSGSPTTSRCATSARSTRCGWPTPMVPTTWTCPAAPAKERPSWPTTVGRRAAAPVPVAGSRTPTETGGPALRINRGTGPRLPVW